MKFRDPLLKQDTLSPKPTPNLQRLRTLLQGQLKNQLVFMDLKAKLYTLILTLDDIRAGPIYLRDLINASRPSNFEEFITFL